jgi:hypothetical protein
MAMKINPFGELIITKKKRMALRKPKLKKYPKKPKQSASLEVKQRYLERCKAVDNDNTAKVAEYRKKKTTLESINKKLSSGVLYKKKEVLANQLRSL